MLLVDSLEVRGADGELREVLMEHDCTLFQREVGPGHEGIRMEKVFNVPFREL